MKNSTYWLQREAETRLFRSQQQGRLELSSVLKMYEEALTNIKNEVNNIYRLYSNATGLDVGELGQIISGSERANFLISVQRNMKALGLAIEDVYNPTYLSRISRLEALKQQIYWELFKIAPNEISSTGRTYTDIIKSTYQDGTIALGEYNGLNLKTFARMDDKVANMILTTPWQGRWYAVSVYGNVANAAKDIPMIIGAAMTMGQSQPKTVNIAMNRLKISKYNAARLVRTETNHFNNAAEAQSYEDFGVDEYMFITTGAGCKEKCRPLNGKIFKLSDKVEGVNYPSMHPNCNCNTIGITKSDPRYIPYQATQQDEFVSNRTKTEATRFGKEQAINGTRAIMGDNLPYHRFDMKYRETEDDVLKMYIDWKKEQEKAVDTNQANM